YACHERNMLDSPEGVKHIDRMLSIDRNAKRLPCRQAGETFFVAMRGGRLAVRTPGVHPGNLSSSLSPCTIVVSGTATVSAVTAPCLSPWDSAPRQSTGTNIT